MIEDNLVLMSIIYFYTTDIFGHYQKLETLNSNFIRKNYVHLSNVKLPSKYKEKNLFYKLFSYF